MNDRFKGTRTKTLFRSTASVLMDSEFPEVVELDHWPLTPTSPLLSDGDEEMLNAFLTKEEKVIVKKPAKKRRKVTKKVRVSGNWVVQEYKHLQGRVAIRHDFGLDENKHIRLLNFKTYSSWGNGLYLIPSPIHGYGVISTQAFEPNDVITEYCGTLLPGRRHLNKVVDDRYIIALRGDRAFLDFGPIRFGPCLESYKVK